MAVPATELDIRPWGFTSAVSFADASGTYGQDLTGTDWWEFADDATGGSIEHYAGINTPNHPDTTNLFYAWVVKPIASEKTHIIIDGDFGDYLTFELSGSGSVTRDDGSGAHSPGIRLESDGSYTIWFEWAQAGIKTVYMAGAAQTSGASSYTGTNGQGVLVGACWIEAVGANSEPTAISPDTLEGTGAVGLPPLGVAGAGAETRTGTGAVGLPALGVAGTGAETRTGTGAVGLPALGVAGAGAETRTGTGSAGLPPLGASGAGAETRTGTGAVVLPALGVAGQGAETRTGTGAVGLPALGVAGTGEVTALLTGTGSVNLPALGVVGAGELGAEPPAPGPAPAPAPAAFASPGGRRIPLTTVMYNGQAITGTVVQVQATIQRLAAQEAARAKLPPSNRQARVDAFKAAKRARQGLAVEYVSMPGIDYADTEAMTKALARELAKAFQLSYQGALIQARTRQMEVNQAWIEHNNKLAIEAATRLLNDD